MSNRLRRHLTGLSLLLALTLVLAACGPGGLKPQADGGGTTPGGTTPGGTTPGGTTPGGTTPAGGKLTGRIVFASERDGTADIYVMNADGTGVKLLVATPDPDDYPRWSPDGTKVAFQSRKAGYYNIYLVNADGTDLRRLTGVGDNKHASWSPDGTKIVYTDGRTGSADIWVMNADGSGAKALTNDYYNDISPAWSPDATKIAFATDKSGNYGLAVMNADGTNRKDFPAARDSFPRWSADGKLLIYQSKMATNSNEEIFTLEVETGVVKQLTDSPFIAAAPEWCGGGQYILYWGHVHESRDIFVMPAAGGEATRLTDNAKNDWSPDWTPK